MKNFLKKYWKEVLIVILLLLLFFWIKNRFKPNDSTKDKIKNELTSLIPSVKPVLKPTEDGKPTYSVKYIPYSVKDTTNKKLLDSIMKEDNIKKHQLLAYNEYTTTLKDSLRLLTVELSKDGYNDWKWLKKYKSGSEIAAHMNERDSILHLDKVDIWFKTFDYTDRKKISFPWSNYNYYHDLKSMDENFTLNGAKVYRVQQKKDKSLFQLSIQNKMNVGLKENSFNSLNSSLMLKHNPNGFVTTGVGYGYLIPLQLGQKPIQMLNFSVDLNLLNIGTKK